MCALIGTAAVCAYPIYMAIKVLAETARNGAVPAEEYPKYVIPYSPISIAVLLFVILMPFFLRFAKKRAALYVSALSLVTFWFTERIFETKILVQTVEKIPLEGWQLGLCAVNPERYETRTWEAVDILLGGYSPTFKIHFYIISAVLILSVLNAVYGFGRMIKTGDKSRRTALILQTVSAGLFLGLCIWACFTAFYRGGELNVSPVSALLMGVFFTVFGVTAGTFAGSFTVGKKQGLSVWLPAGIASLFALAMYAGELMLLHGNLYRFGTGFLFDGLPGIVLAPVDILIIILAGAVTALIFRLINKPKTQKDEWRSTL
ncbi:MAG: hypothetical protein IJR90_09160 [Clostridia bacterium]|nr:hypothetical protein [Clostridia bacterium]